MTSDRIVTSRLVLRRLGVERARAIADGDCSGVVAGSGWPTAETAIVAARTAADPDAVTWLITRDGVVIGECGVRHGPDDDGSTEIGYGLAAPWRADGYGTEAVRGLVEWLGRRTRHRRVTAEVHAGNVASRRLLERLGFTIDRLAPPHVWYVRDLTGN